MRPRVETHRLLLSASLKLRVMELKASPVNEQQAGEEVAVWAKIQELRARYLNLALKVESFLMEKQQQVLTEERELKVNSYISVVRRIISYLTLRRDRIPRSFNMEKVRQLEAHASRVLQSFMQESQSQREPLSPEETELRLSPNSQCHSLFT